MPDEFEFEDFDILNKIGLHPTYTLNPLFIDVFLESISSDANRIFLTVILLALGDSTFKVDRQELARHLHMPSDFIDRAFSLFLSKGYFLEVIDDQGENDQCTHG